MGDMMETLVDEVDAAAEAGQVGAKVSGRFEEADDLLVGGAGVAEAAQRRQRRQVVAVHL